jgi:hypothetical protein
MDVGDEDHAWRIAVQHGRDRFPVHFAEQRQTPIKEDRCFAFQKIKGIVRPTDNEKTVPHFPRPIENQARALLLFRDKSFKR